MNKHSSKRNKVLALMFGGALAVSGACLPNAFAQGTGAAGAAARGSSAPGASGQTSPVPKSPWGGTAHKGNPHYRNYAPNNPMPKNGNNNSESRNSGSTNKYNGANKAKPEGPLTPNSTVGGSGMGQRPSSGTGSPGSSSLDLP
jgi:hypothetical protein